IDPAAVALAEENLTGAKLSVGSFLDAPPEPVDLLLGNPPYVRQRGAKRDLYVDFLDASPAWLKDGGRVALVLSAAWLDVGYGRDVRRRLLEDFAVEWIVESSAERWFPGVKVNTMVLIARKEPSARARSMARVQWGEVRSALPARPTLVRTMPQGALDTERPWGPWLRAPRWWITAWNRSTADPVDDIEEEDDFVDDEFAEEEEPEDSWEVPVVPLGALATIRRGWTTNDNAFFYPPERAGIEPEYLKPLLKSPKRVTGVRGEADALPQQAFVCGLTRGELERVKARGALRWIDDADRTSWSLQAQEPTTQMLVKGYGNKFRQPRFDRPVHYDQQLYGVYPAPGVDPDALAGLMHSSWFGLTLELLGRVNFGDGVLWLGLRDARALPVPDLRRADRSVLRELGAAFRALPEGPVPPVKELVRDPEWTPALQRIDELVADLMGLANAERTQVLPAFSALCGRRHRKAASVGR
ncbi:MAG: Eco57I restriction-modification methylase domain-containing protein, partial [Deltaproteobacteria bacterium]|nr:Eco57I restriction-modification methylase domain-containing protein [Deltaproteobacteria bacterium]